MVKPQGLEVPGTINLTDTLKNHPINGHMTDFMIFGP